MTNKMHSIFSVLETSLAADQIECLQTRLPRALSVTVQLIQETVSHNCEFILWRRNKEILSVRQQKHGKLGNFNVLMLATREFRR